MCWVEERGASCNATPREGFLGETGIETVCVRWPCISLSHCAFTSEIKGLYLCAPDLKGHTRACAVADFSSKEVRVWVFLQYNILVSNHNGFHNDNTHNGMSINPNDKIEPRLQG